MASMFLRTRSSLVILLSPVNQWKQLWKGLTCYRILFYGSDQFSLQTLQTLHQNLKLTSDHPEKCVQDLNICTTSEKNLISSYSRKHRLTLHHWPYDFEAGQHDLGVVVSFGKLIPLSSICNCEYGMLNVHGSLLPALRGGSPIHRAILKEHPNTGVTIMRLKPDKFDVGDILLQEKIELNEHSKTIDVYEPLAKLGARLMLRCIQNLPFYLQNAIKQKEELASYAPKIREQEARINWKQMTLDQVYRLYRAFDQFIPIHCQWINGEPLHLLDMLKPSDADMLELDNAIAKYAPMLVQHLRPGLLYYYKPKRVVCVRCADARWAVFEAVSLKSYKKMSALQFHNGFISKVSQKNSKPVFLDK